MRLLMIYQFSICLRSVTLSIKHQIQSVSDCVAQSRSSNKILIYDASNPQGSKLIIIIKSKLEGEVDQIDQIKSAISEFKTLLVIRWLERYSKLPKLMKRNFLKISTSECVSKLCASCYKASGWPPVIWIKGWFTSLSILSSKNGNIFLSEWLLGILLLHRS